MTAIVALPCLLLFIYFANQTLFNGFLCLVIGLALFEFYAMGLPVQRRAEACFAVATGVMLAMVTLFVNVPGAALASLLLATLVIALVYLFRFRDLQQVSRDLAITVFGLIYIPLLLTHVGMLRGLPFGKSWIFLVLLIVMASDTLAYFVGMQLGRHRLYAAVSPKKSIEGALGGLIGGVLGALLANATFFPQLHWADSLLLGVVVGAFSQVGDLFESLLKRSFGVKDSGTLIPGHGGLLDRLDSLLFAFPLTFYYAVWVFR